MTTAHATSLLIAFGQQKAPYVNENEDNGIEVEIVRAVFAPHNIRITPLYLPFRNLEVALDLFPEVDGAAAVSSQRMENATYIPQFSYFNNVVISNEAQDIELHSIEALQNHSMVAWQGAASPSTVLGEEYERLFGNDATQPEGYMEISSQYQQNAMFWANRVDLILVDERIFHWHREAVGLIMDVNAPVRIHRLWEAPHFTQIAFRDPAIAKLFQAGLTALKESGEYERIYDRYTRRN